MSTIINTAPLEIGKHPNKKHLTRRFLGNLHGQTPVEVKELKAYVAGHSLYAHGRDQVGNQIYHEVRQKYFYV